MTRQLIKTLDIGPFSVKEYKDVKLKKYKEDIKELEFLIGFIYNSVGNNITKILERRLYYLEDNKVITDIHYYYDRLYSKAAYNRKIVKFGTHNDNDKAMIGEPVWLCPPNIEDVHDYNNSMRKEYYVLEKKLNLYLSSPKDMYTIKESKDENKERKTVIKANGFKVFKVNKEMLSRVKKNETETNVYKIPNKSSDKSCSLVIKNIPQYLSREYVYTNIREMFLKFGGISKITILKNKIDNSKLLGIGFIDFYNPTCIDKILQSNNKFVLQHNVLLCERQKKKK